MSRFVSAARETCPPETRGFAASSSVLNSKEAYHELVVKMYYTSLNEIVPKIVSDYSFSILHRFLLVFRGSGR